MTTSTAASAGRSLFEICSRDDPKPRTDSYIPAYGHLARTNIRSLERALAIRRMVIEKLQSPSSGDKFAAIRSVFDAKGAEVEKEAQAARALINGLIEKGRSSATRLR